MSNSESLQTNLIKSNQTANIIDLSDDTENDKFEWIDEFMIDTSMREFRQIGSQQPIWKGAEWTTLAIFQQLQNPDSIGLFVGIDDLSSLPDFWKKKVEYYFSIVSNNEEFDGMKYSHEFYKLPGSNSRQDQGSFQYFKLSDLARFKDPHHPSVYKFHLKTTLIEIFTPSVRPLNYNSKKVTGMVGLENLGATCYLNSLLQMLYHINSFRKAVYKLPANDEELRSSTTLALQSVFRNLQHSNKEVTTKDLTAAFGWTSAEAFMQQDVQEMMRILIDKLEEKMKGTSVDGYAKELFAGTVRSYIKCINVPYESKRDEDFYDIQLDVKGCKNLYESFRKYVEMETLDGENQYDSGVYGKQDAKKGVIFTKFPPVLTLLLKRFDFDLNTMAFMKIHDHFEFPTVLDLDEFLAAPSTEEQEGQIQVKNRYILHSVLVHSGDVGGGHYYAYIRPFTASNYAKIYSSKNYSLESDQNDQAKGWYKFDDEYVMSVKSKEAVEYCYGRKPDDSFRSMSSAYMLVYIRESEAVEIMKDVSDKDIPDNLIDRLDKETKLLRIQEKKLARNKLYTMLNYVTIEEVNSFTSYTKLQDLFNISIMKKLLYLQDSTALGILLMLSEILGVLPIQMRLWGINKTEENSTLRISDDITKEELNQKIIVDRVFVQISGVESYLNADDLTTFQSEYNQINESFKLWKERLYTELMRLPENQLLYSKSNLENSNEFSKVEDSPEYENDPTYGVGIGCSNQQLNEIKEISEELYEELKKELDIITLKMSNLISEFYEELGESQGLFFLKIFDPMNDFPQLPPISTIINSNQINPEIVIKNPNEWNILEDVNDITSIKTFYSEKKPSIEYEPIKSLGLQFINLNQPITDLKSIYLSLLEAKVDHIPQKWRDSFDHSWYFYKLQGSMKCHVINEKATHEEDNISIESDEIFSNLFDEYGGLIVLGLDPSLHNPEKYFNLHLRSFLENQTLFYLTDWLKYRALKKEFVVQPLSPIEIKKLINVSECYFPPTLVEEESSLSSTEPKKRPLDNQTNSSLLYGFEVDLPTNYTVSDIIVSISHKLQLDPRHLALYLVPYLDSDPYDSAKSVIPYTILTEGTLNSNISKIRYYKMPSQYYLFYQILPYPISNVERTEDLRGDYRMVELFICDERIRKFRGLYLSHFQKYLREKDSMKSFLMNISSKESSLCKSPLSTRHSKKRKIAGVSEENDAVSSVSNELKEVENDSDSTEIMSISNDDVEPKCFWNPEILESRTFDPYLYFDDREISLLTRKDDSIGDFTKLLRDSLGIPQNHFEFSGDLSYLNFARSLFPNLTSSQIIEEKILSFEPVVISDKVEIDNDFIFHPIFPLSIGVIRNGIIESVLSYDSSVSSLPFSIAEALCPISHIIKLSIQHVSPEDILFMQGNHPTVKSMVISVFHFTLLGNVVQACEPSLFSGPFLSYVREDDTYSSLFERLCKIAGDLSLFPNIKLAVLESNKIPSFISKPREQNSEEHEDTSAPSIWSIFCEKYEIQSKYNLKESHDYIKSFRSKSKKHDIIYLPKLGIQRMSAELNGNPNLFFQKSKSINRGIKIT